MKASDLVTRMMMVVPTDAANTLLEKIGRTLTKGSPSHDGFAPDGTPLEHKTAKAPIIVDSASHAFTQPLFKSAALQPKRKPARRANRKEKRRARALARAKQRAKR